MFHFTVVSRAESSPDVAARTLACIADVLGAMAGESAGLRSGPARNESWMDAFRLLNVRVVCSAYCYCCCVVVVVVVYCYIDAR